jgi:GST-like protein
VRLIDINAGDQHGADYRSIAPSGKMPAIVDPDGPDGAPVSVFESGAILLYLARKTGRFHGTTERERVEVDQWLMWQMGGLGPMAGQAHHFLKYAPRRDPPQDLPYAKDRFREEVARLYGVLDRRLSDRRWIAGDAFTIADMATWGWASLWEGQQQTLEDKPHMARWLRDCWARPGVKAGRALHADLRGDRSDTWVVRDLFGAG